MTNRTNLYSTPERLVYWYLRINGFLLIENFVVHPDVGSQQRTDADLLGARFKYRQELMINPMEDDPIVAECSILCNIVIAEIKRGACTLNGPWINPHDKNINRILQAIGCFDKSVIREAAEGLYKVGFYANENAICRLLAFGDRKGELPIPSVPQILFSDVIKFIHLRFRKYSDQKASIGNWAKDGQQLKRLAERCRDLPNFECEVRRIFRLPRQKEYITQ